MGLPLGKYHQKNRKSDKIGGKVCAAATVVVTTPAEEVKEYVSPTCPRYLLPFNMQVFLST